MSEIKILAWSISCGVVASGFEYSRDSYWYQHDYFAHTGEKAQMGKSGKKAREKVRGDAELGKWLPKGWHTSENRGFDGRWFQLFPDGPR